MTRAPDYPLTLAHYVSLASEPGWKDYAWKRVQELDADRTGMWAGIKDDLVAAMKQKQEQQ